jgi:acyl-CoA reductase-like NAD-dependent aldehyde dehydrogenase
MPNVESQVAFQLFKEELFLPFVVVGEFASLADALREANKNVYGLTAGFYSKDRAEIRQFLDGIQAGVIYVNREKGATTGAGPEFSPSVGGRPAGHFAGRRRALLRTAVSTRAEPNGSMTITDNSFQPSALSHLLSSMFSMRSSILYLRSSLWTHGKS